MVRALDDHEVGERTRHRDVLPQVHEVDPAPGRTRELLQLAGASPTIDA